MYSYAELIARADLKAMSLECRVYRYWIVFFCRGSHLTATSYRGATPLFFFKKTVSPRDVLLLIHY